MKTRMLISVLTCLLLTGLTGCDNGQDKEKKRKGDGSDDFVFKPPKTISLRSTTIPSFNVASPKSTGNIDNDYDAKNSRPRSSI